MDKQVFGQQVEKLLGKLRWCDDVAVGLCDVSRDCWEKGWKQPGDVPEEAQSGVLAMLLAEVRIRGMMGRSSYFGTQTLMGKAAVYEAAAQAIAEKAHEADTDNVRMCWTEFRRMLSDEIIRDCNRDEEGGAA